jgi:membrane-bound lytic murein transglycosylase B
MDLSSWSQSNFDAIGTYNNSTAYALSVGLLGDAVSGVLV